MQALPPHSTRTPLSIFTTLCSRASVPVVVPVGAAPLRGPTLAARGCGVQGRAHSWWRAPKPGCSTKAERRGKRHLFRLYFRCQKPSSCRRRGREGYSALSFGRPRKPGISSRAWPHHFRCSGGRPSKLRRRPCFRILVISSWHIGTNTS